MSWMCGLLVILLPGLQGVVSATEQRSESDAADAVQSCAGQVTWSQPPTWVSGASSIDEYDANRECKTGALIAMVADDIPLDTPPITAIRFWGITNGDPWSECPPFRIRFWLDDNGQPIDQWDGFVYETVAVPTCVAVEGYPGLPSYEHCIVLSEPVDPSAQPLWLVCQALYCRSDWPGYELWFWAFRPLKYGSQIWYYTSALLDYFYWSPGIIFGDLYDASFELLSTGVVPTQPTTWSELKALFR